MDRDKKYQDDIVRACGLIMDFTQGLTLGDFKKDLKTQDAVTRELEIIGEAPKRLSDEFKARYNLPWRDMAGFRDKAIHDYMLLELETVWSVVENNVPELIKLLKN